MEEGHQLAGSAVEGLLVDQPDAGAGGLLELALDVVGAEGDVVNAAVGVLLQELGDGALRVGRLQQFEVDLAHAEEGGAHFLGRHFFAVFAFEPEGFFVIGHGFVQRPDGDSQVINFLNHKIRFRVQLGFG